MNKEWMKAVGVKVVKTMAETALGMIGTSVLITDVSWTAVASATVLSGIVTVLFNLKSL